MTVKRESTVYYTIADHLIAVKNPLNQITSGLINNYEPFRNRDNLNGSPIVQLSCNHFIQKPLITPKEKFQRDLNHYAVYSMEDDLVIEMTRNKQKFLLKAASDWRNFSTDLPVTDKTEYSFLNSFIIITYTLASSTLKTVKLHASVIEKNGKALLFLGKSGTGKSTHSRLWQEFVPGSTLLNDDEPVVRIFNDGSVKVYGTPWSGKTPCYRNISAEVKAIVCLFQSPENKLTRIVGIRAFPPVFQSCSVLRTSQKNKDLVCNSVAQIIETVPVYRLDCRPDYDAVRLTQTLLQ